MSRAAQVSLSRLDEIVGGEHVLRSEAHVRAREVCGLIPSAVIQPADADQVAEILRFAVAEKLAVIPTGGGTKLGIGCVPARYDISLDLSQMNRVLAYDPKDLTLGVEPGARIEDLLRTLGDQRQFLPLDVPFLDRATIGGIVSANSSSPLRHAYGAARDFCLGMEFVTGEGKRAKSGGRVVKNVTGYDLHKLLIGSLGTLAVITRLNFRTFPLPAAQGIFIATFPSAKAASHFCLSVSHSVLMPQVVEIADPPACQLLFSGEVSAHLQPRSWCVVLSVTGQPAVVDRHARELGHLASRANAEEFLPLPEADGVSVLARFREFPRLAVDAAPSALIFRCNVLPGAIPAFLASLKAIAERERFDLATLTRASGIVYAVFVQKEGTEDSPVKCASLVQKVLDLNAVPGANAQSMLEWCPTEVKRLVGDVWGPARPDLPLMRKVKASFDPHNVLSPGRFAGGI
jgi:glycolate oxidase FAD binding subunit